MTNNNPIHFQKLAGISYKEILGECFINIVPGGYCVFDSVIPTNHLHYHEFYELCIVTSGSGEFVHGEVVYKLGSGDVFIANPGVFHEIRLIKDKKGIYTGKLDIVFFKISIKTGAQFESPIKAFEENILREFLTNHSVISKSQKHLFSYLDFLEHYTESASTGKFGLQQIVKNMSFEAMFALKCFDQSKTKSKESLNDGLNIYGNYQKASETSNSVLDLSINYISANIHQKIYLSEIAANACSSKRNIQYVFKKEFGKTVSDYINIKKTAIAASYLKMNFTINDVCNLIAISDVAQFSRLFKKYHGISPKKFQMDYLSSKNVTLSK